MRGIEVEVGGADATGADADRAGLVVVTEDAVDRADARFDHTHGEAEKVFDGFGCIGTRSLLLVEQKSEGGCRRGLGRVEQPVRVIGGAPAVDDVAQGIFGVDRADRSAMGKP